ncbi:MAG: SDR family oxidoreductase, partial [Candidatus Doudnabacteria bacterium]|nr:SDR family oxidoreductase [Candidatus Doudnabacteria bacterium]
ILINNVGLLVLKKFEDMDEHEINQVLDTNLRAHMLLTKGLLPLLKAAEYPHIVFMSSMAAKSSIVGESVYAATKAAISNFANVLRNEFVGRIKVSTVHAWGVNTWGSKDVDRLLRPEDVAEAVEFIVSRGPNCLVESIDLGNIHQWRGGEAPWSPQ